jgi:hypothetical protein
MESNVMRHDYRALDDAEKSQLRQVKDLGLTFYTFCDNLGNTRELSLAKTKIEEAVMWATKSITR